MTGEPPRIPIMLQRALDRIQQDAVVGDLLEEYVEHVRPRLSRFRARLWLWKHLCKTIAVGFFKLARQRRPRVFSKRGPASWSHGSPRREIMGTLWNDTRYGLRMLLRTPALSLVAVVTVALGVGLTTHTFSIVYATLMRGLPYEGADRLMYLDRNDLSEDIENMSVSVHDFTDWRDQQKLFEDLGAARGGTVNVVDAEGRPERFDGGLVSAGLFAQVGVQPLMGRGFIDEDDRGHTPQTIILGYDVWQTRYGGDPDILGQTIRANGRPTTIIGVMPPGFRFPFQEEVWLPLNLDPVEIPRGEGWSVQVFGRLKEGVSLDEARTEMAGIAQRLATEYPQSNEGIGVSVKTFVEGYMPPQISAVLYVMLFAVFGVLLIACANVANLLLARSLIRSKEVAIRSALGASRGRVIRQLLVEATLLSLIGGVLGIVLSKVGIDLFNAALVNIEKPYWIEIALYPPVLAFAFGVTLLASIVSGTVPAIRASGGDLHDVLKDESRSASSLRMGKFSAFLVIGEVAVSCALLVTAGMMIRSVVNLKSLDMGFETAGVLTARVGLFEIDYPNEESRVQFFEGLKVRLEGLSGVQSAALTTRLPAVGQGGSSFAMEGETYVEDRDYPVANRTTITADFFETFGVSFREGRDFSTQDRKTSMPVAIVNETFAQRYSPDNSVLGKRIRLGRSQSEFSWMTIVGVVPDLKVGSGAPGGLGGNNSRSETIYTPLPQWSQRFMSIAVTTGGDPMSLAPLVRDAVASLDPNLPIYWVDTMDGVIADNTWAFGLFGSLFTIFGTVALFMAAVGLYGVMAFSVSRRTQEMGVRMALGAYSKDIVRLVLKKGLLQLGIGMGIGLGIGMAMARPLQVVMFDVNPTDPFVYGAIIGTLGLAGLFACLLPARRATRIDLVDALRPE